MKKLVAGATLIIALLSNGFIFCESKKVEPIKFPVPVLNSCFNAPEIPDVKTFMEKFPLPQKEEPEDNDLVCLGLFHLTGYCPCEECSEGYGRMTSTGAIATANHTIAVDPSIIPYGTHVIINNTEYVAEDCGGLINDYDIDIFVDCHSDTFSDYCNGEALVFLY